MKWIDIGVNLTNKRFDQDREQVIQRAIDNSVTQLIITGTNTNESQQAFALTQTNPQHLFSTAGCHPHDSKNFESQDLVILENLLSFDNVVAVGECGLDFNRDFSPREKQIEVFKTQLELAVKTQKPLFLHERDAFDSNYQILKDYMPKINRVVIHCFTGQKSHLHKYLDLGLFIGITGWICDERRGQELYELVKEIPDNRLMIETDAPYLTPRDLRPKPKGGRNAPEFLPHIAQTVANARQQTLSELNEICYNNSQEFFNLPIE